MSIEQGILYQHAFWLRYMNDEEMQEALVWCNEKCRGQWLYIQGSGYKESGVAISFRCRAEKKGPYEGKQYPSSQVEERGVYIISFELEKDAAMFKLTWMGET